MAPQSGAHEPVYLTLEDVLELFAAIVGGTPVDAASQLRNRDAREGALARPATHAHYQDADLALQAAAALPHGITETQPFIDGNKRAGLVAMLTFLEINGTRLQATDPELAASIIDLSDRSTPDQLAERIRGATQRAT